MRIYLITSKEESVEIFLDQEYQKEAHSGIREYYESYGVRVLSAGISPEQEWRRRAKKTIIGRCKDTKSKGFQPGLRLKALVFSFVIVGLYGT